MRVFADTSALLKRYVAEAGSAAFEELLARTDQLVIAAVTPLEARSALQRRRRDGSLREGDWSRLRLALNRDVVDMVVVPAADQVLTLACDLVERHPLRALDALQLSCALSSAPQVFACADAALLQAARAEGLECFDPAAEAD